MPRLHSGLFGSFTRFFSRRLVQDSDGNTGNDIKMSNTPPELKSKPEAHLDAESAPSTNSGALTPPEDSKSNGEEMHSEDYAHSEAKTPLAGSAPTSPRLGPRSVSSGSFQEDWEAFPPMERLTVFDLLDNLALPQRLEKWQTTIAAHKDRIKRQRDRFTSTSSKAKDRVIEEWRRRIPPPEEQLSKYRRRMGDGIDRLSRRWNEAKTVSLREKTAFICGVLNVFLSGYIIGAWPEWFHVWYTVQLCYFLPLRYFLYHRRGYQYFLADLCYFVNFMCMLSIWAFPNSKRVFITTYALAFGNNAVAIAMWRNSLVFHSFDKVTSLFIHIMPPVALHTIVHVYPAAAQAARFPAVYAIKHATPGSAGYYNLFAMIGWATLPYMTWQLSYHFGITVRKQSQIKAGRPTSFTWLRRSYSKTWIGKIVLSLPESLQNTAFMGIQYLYAVLTMLPSPIWLHYRLMSSLFLGTIFVWSIYNGATFYIDIYSKRFQNELEQLRKDVAKWQVSSENGMTSPLLTPLPMSAGGSLSSSATSVGENQQNQQHMYFDQDHGARDVANHSGSSSSHKRLSSFDQLPLLDSKIGGITTAAEMEARGDDNLRTRKGS